MVGEGGQGIRPLGWVTPGPLQQLTGGYLYDARIVDGLRVRGWPVGVLDIRAGGWPLDLAAGRRLAAGLRHAHWSSVVVDELAHPALAAAHLTGRLRPALRGTPLILLVHHLRCSEPGPWHGRALARMVEGLVVRTADLVVCTSETTARTVRPLTRRGIQTAVVRPGWDTHEGLSGRANPDGEVNLLLVGHWTPRKGILDALAALQRTGLGVTLDLVGEQDRDPAYAARVWAALRAPDLKDRVRVHGRVSAGMLRRRFSEADALLLPSSHEGYGMVLAEALAAGLPIVATRVGAVPEVVRGGQEAELVQPGDVGALARAIERLARSPDERHRRAALARERAASLPTWSDSILAFERLLQAVAAPSATRQAG
ncbi:MAG: glycosyltransferase family 4 protein [Chloroflexi bacterium]|nr:glycosyltransferase family 4 protein [Chloroflexota bacterium]